MAVPPVPDAGHQPAPPACFRHPGRETYVSCVRCGRPACPDCLRSAAVGQQCVECVREGNRGTRQPRTAFGGRVAGNALVTWILVGINMAFYLAEWVYPKIVTDLSLIGNAALTSTGPLVGVADGQWYRLITSAFLHEPGFSGLGPAHIIFNMWALIFIGPALEQPTRPAALPRRVPGERARRCRALLSGRPDRTSKRSAPQARSSACSARGSCWPGDCGWITGRSSC